MLQEFKVKIVYISENYHLNASCLGGYPLEKNNSEIKHSEAIVMHAKEQKYDKVKMG